MLKNKKRLLIQLTFSLLLFFSSNSAMFSQEWINSFKPFSTGVAKITDAVFDATNNKYFVSGTFEDSLYIGIGDTLLVDSLEGTFLCAFDGSFAPLWIYEIDGKHKENLSDIGLDENGNIYITGMFRSDYCKFGSDPDTTLTTTGLGDNYLAKISNDGSFLWVKNIGQGGGFQFGGKVILDNDNNVILTQNFLSSITLHDGNKDTTLYTGAAGTLGTLIVKLDSEGNIRMNQIYNLESTGASEITGIHQHSEYYYFSGKFKDDISFKSDTIYSSSGTNEIFLIKTDTTLGDIWTKRSYGNDDDLAGAIASDKYGNSYLTGFFKSTNFQVDSLDGIKSQIIRNNGGGDIFVLKYNRNGQLQWGRSYGTASTDWSREISQKQDLLYITGYYDGQIIFGDDTLNNAGGHDFFVGTFDTDGNKLRAFGLDQQGANDESGVVLSIAPDNSVYTGGYFKSSSIGIGDTTFNLNGTQDMFLGRFRSELAATFTSTQNVSCPAGSDGSLVVKPYFGAAPYNYTWSHDGGLNNDTATSLTAGQYTVTVTDAVDSTVVISKTLTEPDPITFNAAITNVTGCYGDSTGAINLSPAGGTSPYVYFWSTSDGGGLNTTAQDQTGLAAGTYTVTITDDNGCTNDTSIVISQPSNISFAGTSITHITNTVDGAVDLAVSGATSPYSNYSWTGPNSFTASNQDISGLTDGGTYSVTLQDDNACSFDTSVVVIDSTRMNIYFHQDSVQDVSCNGGSDGQAIVTVIEPNGQPSYAWSGNVSSSNDSLAYNLSAGKYYVTVTDLDGSLTDSVVIEEPQALSSSFTGASTTTLDCYGDADGVIDISVSGGTSPYTYNWSTSDGSGLNATASGQNGLTAGTYDVTVTDDNGCTTTNSYTINQPADLVVGVALNQGVSCHGYSDAEAEANPSGGTGAYYYQWNDGANQTTKIADGLEANSYKVTVTDDNGCTEIGNISISEPDPISITYEEYNDVTCYGYTDGTININATGGTGDLYYTLTPGSSTNLNGEYSALAPDTYTISVTDDNSCPAAEATGTVGEPTQIQIDETINDATDATTANGSINITVSGGTESGAYGYNWSWDEGTLGSPTLEDQSNLETGNYHVTVTDDNSCTQSESYSVSVKNVYVTSTGYWADVVESTFDVDTGITVTVRSGYEVIVPGTEVDSANNFILEPTALLTVNSGGDLLISGDLTMQSDATGAASLLNNGTLTLQGTAHVQRYLESNSTSGNWRYISSPVTGALSEAINLGSNEYLYEWDEFNNTWAQITASDHTLEVGKGYAAAQTLGSRNVTFSGALNNGNITLGALTRTSGNSYEGFNLVGNPYPSALDLGNASSHAGITWNNLDSTVWYRTDGNFATYNWSNGTGQNGADSRVPAMQSFWVRVSTTAGGSMDVTNSARIHDKLTSFYKNYNEANQIFRIEAVKDGYSDEAVVGFYPMAQNGYESNDSEKRFTNDANYPQIFTFVGEKQLAINGLTPLEDSIRIPLGFQSQKSGTFTFNATNMEEFDSDIEVYLEDKHMNQLVDLRQMPVYQFDHYLRKSTEETDTRFFLHFKQMKNATSTGKVNDGVIDIYSHEKLVYVDLKNGAYTPGVVQVFSILGHKVAERDFYGNQERITIPLRDRSPGYYFVKVIQENRIVTQKIVLQ